MDRITNTITVGGVAYPLIYNYNASVELTAKFKDIDDLAKKLANPENLDEAINVVVDILVVLTTQGIEYMKYYQENGYLEKNPSNIQSNAVSLTPDLAAEKTQIFANLETIYDQAVADMIMHGVTDDAWDSMINSLKAAGADRYIEIYQNAYDEYLAK